jgi:hypothetical protein
MIYILSRYAFWKHFNIWKTDKSIEYLGNLKRVTITHFQITVTLLLQRKFLTKFKVNNYKTKTHF